MTDWLDILRREVDRTSVTGVARRLGYARPSISLVYHGRYPGSTDRIRARVIEVFADEIVCPHSGASMRPLDCRELRSGPMPTSNAKRLRHWTACRTCPLNPETTT